MWEKKQSFLIYKVFYWEISSLQQILNRNTWEVRYKYEWLNTNSIILWKQYSDSVASFIAFLALWKRFQIVINKRTFAVTLFPQVSREL